MAANTPPTTPSDAAADQNQGEGNRDAARRFNKDEQRFVQSGQVDDAARRAAPQSDEEAARLAQAERRGRQHAKGEDPTVPGANAEVQKSHNTPNTPKR